MCDAGNANAPRPLYALLRRGHVDCYKRSESSASIDRVAWSEVPLLRDAVRHNTSDVYDCGLFAKLLEEPLGSALLCAGALDLTTKELQRHADTWGHPSEQELLLETEDEEGEPPPPPPARPASVAAAKTVDDLTLLRRLQAWIPRADPALLAALVDATLATEWGGEFGVQRSFNLCDVVRLHMPAAEAAAEPAEPAGEVPTRGPPSTTA